MKTYLSFVYLVFLFWIPLLFPLQDPLFLFFSRLMAGYPFLFFSQRTFLRSSSASKRNVCAFLLLACTPPFTPFGGMLARGFMAQFWVRVNGGVQIFFLLALDRITLSRRHPFPWDPLLETTLNLSVGNERSFLPCLLNGRHCNSVRYITACELSSLQLFCTHLFLVRTFDVLCPVNGNIETLRFHLVKIDDDCATRRNLFPGLLLKLPPHAFHSYSLLRLITAYGVGCMDLFPSPN